MLPDALVDDGDEGYRSFMARTTREGLVDVQGTLENHAPIAAVNVLAATNIASAVAMIDLGSSGHSGHGLAHGVIRRPVAGHGSALRTVREGGSTGGRGDTSASWFPIPPPLPDTSEGEPSMSSYAVTDDGTLLVTWWDGTSRAARTICTRPQARDELRGLAADLTRLSEQCWRIYVDPIHVDDRSGGEPEDDRTHLAGLPEVVERPPLPGADGYIVASYVPVVEAAERVGRAVHAIGDHEVRAAVLAEVRVEAQAVLAADLGDLSAPGRQAVRHSKDDASPAQVEAASQSLAANPFSAADLLSDYDPTAACVAAAGWFHCAALVAAEELGCSDLSDVIRLADDIEAMPVSVLSVVLAMLHPEDSNPHNVIALLVQEAQAVAEAHVVDIDALARGIRAAHDLASRAARTEHDRQAVLSEFRLCLLDPARPAPDLLDALLAGIDGCWMVWNEEVASEQDAGDLDDDELDDQLDEDAEAEQDRRSDFADLVREQMALRAGR